MRHKATINAPDKVRMPLTRAGIAKDVETAFVIPAHYRILIQGQRRRPWIKMMPLNCGEPEGEHRTLLLSADLDERR